ncbi:MAG TPA: Fur family transcriptional regulator [Clostridia bacterium]|nr:Fur family transcriptional regulator [Clostridia bacterium]
MEEAKKETRNTKQKKFITDCLKNYPNSHLTAEEIYHLIKENDQHISIATVYRNLKLLEEQGVIRKNIVTEEASSFYELTDKSEPHSHHHLVCRQCGAIIDFEADLLDSLEKMVEATTGFNIEDHRVVFYGKCKKCSAQNKQGQ